MADAPASLEDLRQAILAIDTELVALLGRRASLSIAVGKRKRAGGQSDIFRPSRESALMRQLEAIRHEPLPKEHLRAIYREILSSSRNLQHPQRVAFPGPKDSLAHNAGRKLLGSLAEFQPKPSLVDVFAAVADETCDIGIVPLATTLQSDIGQVLDGFLRHPELHIRAETGCHTRFAVIGRTPADRPGTNKSSILFALPDKPDRIAALLRIFASHAIPLCTPKSRPLPGEPGNTLFFADIEGDMYADAHAAALNAAREQCFFLRILGSYPSDSV